MQIHVLFILSIVSSYTEDYESMTLITIHQKGDLITCT